MTLMTAGKLKTVVRRLQEIPGNSRQTLFKKNKKPKTNKRKKKQIQCDRCVRDGSTRSAWKAQLSAVGTSKSNATNWLEVGDKQGL